ncbi:MAG: TIGR02453 family protein, partial [Pseudomonadota bacterium]
RLHKVSEHFVAEARKVGGSMMRIYKDTRFSKDKTPYKTNVGIQFRHEQGKDVHAPGFYVHFEPGDVFLGVGIWHPESEALAKIRTYMDEHQSAWKKATNDKAFKKQFELAGDSLKRPPKGYDKEHPLIDDLKRKDFIAVTNMDEATLLSQHFIDEVDQAFQRSSGFMQLLCKAMGLPF